MGDVREHDSAHDKREKKINKVTEEKLESKHEEKNEIQERNEDKTEKLQWHPAFYAELQIELEEESENLIFENEHQLGTKPKEIDVLIIKKNKDISIQKNIGKIFRKYNIIEYKSPEDSLGINDFYRVFGYTYFYKADTKEEESIRIEYITISFVCKRYPYKLIKYLVKRGKLIEKADEGILYIKGWEMPVQLIVTSRLSEKKNFWLKNLTDDLRNKKTVDKMLEEYGKHRNNIYYKSVMDIIVRANGSMFKEECGMCDAMMEILKDRIEVLNQKSSEETLDMFLNLTERLEMLGGKIPSELREKLRTEKKIDVLKEYLNQAMQANSMEEFMENV